MKNANTVDFVSTFGPTPLGELTARLPDSPEQVAHQINHLTKKNVLQVTDGSGKKIEKDITAEEAGSPSDLLVGLTPRSLRQSFANDLPPWLTP